MINIICTYFRVAFAAFFRLPCLMIKIVKWRYKVVNSIFKAITLAFFLTFFALIFGVALTYISSNTNWLISIHSDNTEKIMSIISTGLSLIIGEFLFNCTEWYFWLSDYELSENAKVWKNMFKLVSTCAVISLVAWLLTSSISLTFLMYIFITVLSIALIFLIIIALFLKYSSRLRKTILELKGQKQ